MAQQPRFDHAAWTGRCECGEVAFEVRGPMRGAVACGCSQCRRTNTTSAVFCEVRHADLVFQKQSGLTWYRSSDAAQRSFCRTCGSTICFRGDKDDHDDGSWFLSAGLLESPVGIDLIATIYAETAQPHDAVIASVPAFEADYDTDFQVPWFDGPGIRRTAPL